MSLLAFADSNRPGPEPMHSGLWRLLATSGTTHWCKPEMLMMMIAVFKGI